MKLLLDAIKDAISIAINDFGGWTFCERGPAEVMDFDKWTRQLNDLPADQCRDLLVALYSGTQYERYFVSDILESMQDMDPDRWDVLMRDDRLEAAYNGKV